MKRSVLQALAACIAVIVLHGAPSAVAGSGQYKPPGGNCMTGWPGCDTECRPGWPGCREPALNRPPHHNHGNGHGDGSGFYANRRISCGQARAVVEAKGYNEVRAVDCRGKRYDFTGRRLGRAYFIMVNARTGFVRRSPM